MGVKITNSKIDLTSPLPYPSIAVGFTTVSSKTVVLVLFDLCVGLWLLATGFSVCLNLFSLITKIRLFKYIENFTTKNWKFLDKNSDIFHITAQNIDCGYSLEPPRRGGCNGYLQSMFLSSNTKNNVISL